MILAHHESARPDVPGAALLDAALLERLARHPDAAALGLPAGAVLWSGTGF